MCSMRKLVCLLLFLLTGNRNQLRVTGVLGSGKTERHFESRELTGDLSICSLQRHSDVSNRLSLTRPAEGRVYTHVFILDHSLILTLLILHKGVFFECFSFLIREMPTVIV